MAKLRVMSDLHLEFGPLDLEPLGEDVLVLAGDLDLADRGAEWARGYATAHGVPAVMIAGNHEFYNRRGGRDVYPVDEVLARLRRHAAEEPLFHFLEGDAAVVAGVRFVGCTLWTDFALNGDAAAAMIRAHGAMNDYNLIWETAARRFMPGDALMRHRVARNALEERLADYRAGAPLVVLTHHLPSARSIAGRYADTAYNAAYASNLDELVARSGAALWIHGHTHVSQDYRIGNTRVICNPRGYAGYELNPAFDPRLIIEV